MGCEMNKNENESDKKLMFEDKFSEQYNDEANDSDSQS